MKLKGSMINLAKTIVLPLTLFAIFAIIALIQDNPFLTDKMLLYTLRTACVTVVIALAFALHLMSGGFDFSIGSVVYLSVIVAGRTALAGDLGPWGFLALAMVVGAVLCLAVSGLYITLRLPLMVLTLGILMVYEALTQLVFGGNGLRIMNKLDYAMFGKTYNTIAIAAVCMLVVWFLLKYTRFGFHTRALARGQRIAFETGIVEWKNVVLRFAICGVLLGIAGVLHVSGLMTLQAAKDMNSTVVMWGAMMPVIIGLSLARYSNMPVGVFMGVLSMQIIDIGFVCMGTSGTISTVISGVFLLVFVIFTENKDKLMRRRLLRRLLNNDTTAVKTR
jgi:ribose transport system permease protein